MAAASNLTHILLCGGAISEWASTNSDEWRARIELVATAAHNGGAAWATIIPNGDGSEADAELIRERLVTSCDGVRYAERVVVLARNGVTVIVDPLADGQARIAKVAARVTTSEVSEQHLGAAVSAPAPGEPDLVIVLGSATTLPRSLVWELAYAEIVFFDAPWRSLDAEHLEMSIDDFTRRDRRFGGVDS
ncbi:MAG: undecaprenyl diphosphate synthase family protein [Actinomycetota bacterium]